MYEYRKYQRMSETDTRHEQKEVGNMENSSENYYTSMAEKWNDSERHDADGRAMSLKAYNFSVNDIWRILASFNFFPLWALGFSPQRLNAVS